MDRIINTFDTTAEQLRSALTYKDAVKLHQSCGALLFFMDKLEKIAAGSDFPEMRRGLMAQFMSGFLDCDLVVTLEETIPNTADIVNVKAFRRGYSATFVFFAGVFVCFGIVLD